MTAVSDPPRMKLDLEHIREESGGDLHGSLRFWWLLPFVIIAVTMSWVGYRAWGCCTSWLVQDSEQDRSSTGPVTSRPG